MGQTLTTNLNNINVDTVENCNLLCKLVLDYMSTDKCEIEVLDYGKSNTKKQRIFRIVYPEGSFINYRDTNYELTYAYFFYPSRHSIDGERYDLEVNIYHGIFRDGPNPEDKKRGIIAHTHYHNDDNQPTTYQHKHFHYHLPGEEETEDDKKAHYISVDDDHTKNVVTCLLYNMGKHVGNDVNIFFNQFIHHPKFKKMKIKEFTTNDKKFTIDVHDNWNIEKIYPKKRSYFMYDHGINTYVVFDTIQTISKEIIDRIYERGIKGAYGPQHEVVPRLRNLPPWLLAAARASTPAVNPEKIVGFDLNSIKDYDVNQITNVLYRKNIEVITDEQYKKTKRAQIKDLLSLSRMSTYKPSKKTSKEYYQDGEAIIKSISGGSNTGYLTSKVKEKMVADSWRYYGRDKPIEKKINEIDDWNKIVFKQEYLQQYGYLERIYKYYKKKNNSFDEDGEPEAATGAPAATGAEKSQFEQYLDERKLNVNNNLKKRIIYGLSHAVRQQNNEGELELNENIMDQAQSAVDSSDITDQDAKRIQNFLNDKNNVEYQEDIEKLREEIVTFTDNLRRQSAFFFYRPDEIVNEKKLRFFFEELTPGWNQKHGIDKSIITQLNEEGIRKTLEDMKAVFTGLPPDLKDELIFVEEGPELTRTLSNEECQQWMSNETHYEGDLWKFWEKPTLIPKNRDAKAFEDLSMDEKRKIGEGLMEYDETTEKWSPHNKCRNPGNRAAAPWCYTKNPNKRWEYCAKPYYSDILGKIVLLAIFVFIGVIAFFAIKKLFFYEYPMRFVAKLTGGTLATSDTFTANPAAAAKPASK